MQDHWFGQMSIQQPVMWLQPQAFLDLLGEVDQEGDEIQEESRSVITQFTIKIKI